jgi:phosphoribosylanthranilate isomerase
MELKLKVCGMRSPENITALAALKPDYMGFIFYDRSKRFVADMDPGVTTSLPDTIKATGVFVNESIERVIETINKYQLKAIQLHGNESAGYCERLKTELPYIEVVKAFGINDDFTFKQLDEYQKHVDFFLFDTQTPEHGGSGQTFNWQVINQYKLDVPYFLSGGIGLEQVAEILKIVDPRLYAIDVNSRFETAPAEKDINQLKTFKNQLLGNAQ